MDRPRLDCWTIIEAGADSGVLQLRIRLTPKGNADAVEGFTDAPEGPALKVRVRAVPQDGAANKALIAFVAKWLSLPKSSISLSAGTKSRTKMLSIVTTQNDLERILNQLEALDE